MILINRPDGGKKSGVISWGIEIKWLFSIILLKFKPNFRENYHSHAFNAVTVWLKGNVLEERIMPDITMHYARGHVKYTPRENVHKIHCHSPTAWALSFRGPWSKEWSEYSMSKQRIRLTHGRKEI